MTLTLTEKYESVEHRGHTDLQYCQHCGGRICMQCDPYHRDGCAEGNKP